MREQEDYAYSLKSERDMQEHRGFYTRSVTRTSTVVKGESCPCCYSHIAFERKSDLSPCSVVPLSTLGAEPCGGRPQLNRVTTIVQHVIANAPRLRGYFNSSHG